MTLARPFGFLFKLLLVGWLSTLGLVTSLRAHEVQPAIMDFLIAEDQVEISIDWMVEAAVAGLDLETLANTQDAEDDGEYDRLRALEPEQMVDEIRAAWPGISESIYVRVGGETLPLALEAINVPEVGNIELARISTVEFIASLPEEASELTIGWAPALGPLVVRQAGVEGGYAAFLSPGMESDPVPRSGTFEQTAWEALVSYIEAGFDHIVPKGLDHILFVLGLFFLSLRMAPLLWQVTAFTLAHTITLALGALEIIRISPDIVEPLIAASIVYVGVENLFFRNLTPWRPIVVFLFGLLHGLGFASVLQDFGLGEQHFVAKLIGFNVGVEVGQLAVIAAAWITLALFFGRFDWYHRRIAAPVSIAIALIAAFWVLERTGTIDPSGPWSVFTMLTEGGFNPLWVALAAIALAAVLTGSEMLIITEDLFREVAGTLTSFLMFLAIVATFTAGAWTLSVVVAVAWVLALRLQALGEPSA